MMIKDTEIKKIYLDKTDQVLPSAGRYKLGWIEEERWKNVKKNTTLYSTRNIW